MAQKRGTKTGTKHSLNIRSVRAKAKSAAQQPEDFQDVTNKYAASAIANIREMLDAVQNAKDDDAREDAQQSIYDDPLEVAQDKGERFDGTRHYMILLGTGGPASRITGELDEHGEPSSAVFEYQDWGTPWTAADVTDAGTATMLEYVQCFFFEGSHEN